MNKFFLSSASTFLFRTQSVIVMPPAMERKQQKRMIGTTMRTMAHAARAAIEAQRLVEGSSIVKVCEVSIRMFASLATLHAVPVK